MAQFLRPSANITQTNTVGSYTDIDEVSFSDTDYVTSNDNSAGVFEFRITVGGGVGDPAVNTGHTVRLRHAKSDTNVAPSTDGNTQTGDYYLYQGATLIATLGNITVEGAFTALSYTLTGTEADNITDYDDLRVRCDWPASGGGSPGIRRGGATSWAEMELPDAPSAYNMPAAKGSFVLSGKNIDFPYVRKYTLPAEKGSFLLDGKDITFTYVRKYTLPAEKGSFTLTGKNIDFFNVTNYSLPAEKGSFNLTGKDSSLQFGRVLATEKGSFTLDGKVVTLTYVRSLTLLAEKGSFLLSGKNVTLSYLPFQQKTLIFGSRRVVYNTKIVTYNGN